MTVTVIPRDPDGMPAVLPLTSYQRSEDGEGRTGMNCLNLFRFDRKKLGWGDIHLSRIINPAFAVLEKTMIQMKQVEKSRWKGNLRMIALINDKATDGRLLT